MKFFKPKFQFPVASNPGALILYAISKVKGGNERPKLGSKSIKFSKIEVDCTKWMHKPSFSLSIQEWGLTGIYCIVSITLSKSVAILE
jgi:hypothetical protein